MCRVSHGYIEKHGIFRRPVTGNFGYEFKVNAWRTYIFCLGEKYSTESSQDLSVPGTTAVSS